MPNLDKIRSAPRLGMAVVALALAASGALTGCHRAESPAATQADVDTARAEARKEVAQARIEARKDVRSAAKVSGGDPRNVALARATGTFDIAMAQADGDHKVALQKCLLLEPAAQKTCQDQADADFQKAAASAKADRALSGNRG